MLSNLQGALHIKITFYLSEYQRNIHLYIRIVYIVFFAINNFNKAIKWRYNIYFFDKIYDLI